MADDGNIGTSDDEIISSPMPFIGLYIVGASWACLAMMFVDIKVGVSARKKWLPCKVFKLNSVTLTLLGVVAKIPVDLTSSMPSPYDQLSKLTGTVMICISMGFFMPSLGASNQSECFTNMLALSIFVITVAIDISIQLGTGVIVFFFEEHIIILCLMLLLLLFLWDSSINSRSYKIRQATAFKDLVNTGNSSMFGRLKLCYLYSYSSDPYFVMCKDKKHASVSIVCLVCSVILIKAMFFKNFIYFPSKHSVYGWSVSLLVYSQSFAVIVGTLAIIYRWLALFRGMEEIQPLLVSLWRDDDVAIGLKSQIVGKWHTWQTFVGTLYKKSISAAQLLIVIPFFQVRKCFGLYKHDRLEFFDDIYHECVIAATEYIAVKSVDELIKFREVHLGEARVTHVMQLLPRTAAAQQLYPRVDDYQDYLDGYFSGRDKKNVCSLSVALLMKIAQICIPTNHLELPFPNAYLEAKDIIHFIDKTLLLRRLEDTSRLSYAKALWEHGDFSCLIPDSILGGQPDLNRAVAIMEILKEKFGDDDICYEMKYMVNFINLESYSSIEELSTFIKEMLTYMLRLLITQLPVAIHKSLSECPWEEFEKGVQRALSFMFKMESAGALENVIGWSFPPASGISSFITDGTPAPDRAGPLKRLLQIYPHSTGSL